MSFEAKIEDLRWLLSLDLSHGQSWIVIAQKVKEFTGWDLHISVYVQCIYIYVYPVVAKDNGIKVSIQGWPTEKLPPKEVGVQEMLQSHQSIEESSGKRRITVVNSRFSIDFP